LKSPDNAQNYKTRAKDALLFGAAGNIETALSYFLNGCTLVFLKTDFTAELVSRLEKLTVDYRSAYASYRTEEITVSELDRRCQALEIFDETILDRACDRLISALLNMRELSLKPVRKNGLNMNRLAKFDEVADNDLALVAARQSVVLLKNDGALPLSATERVAVLGECAKDYGYQSDFFSGSATRESTPFTEINGYDINAIGFASGYARAQSGKKELIDTALELAKEAGTALVYLSAEKGENVLPAGQTELIDALYKNSVKIIAVVASDGSVDLGFADKCAAVLLTYRAGQEGSRAVLDILKGIATPSGRLTEALSPRYPFGYGLTYTQFEYSNLKINERGVSCTVKNVGSFGGFAVPQFYLQKPLSDGFFKQKLLRGFQKVYGK
ncbi:MAG: glycoside hydrolase family 3 C-terminal domain-containing protein, partial [Clostridia bacterium]|nr:glycoside hydrolase family 3 C-terminal domain-containing protein [Clostridia bacterium]